MKCYRFVGHFKKCTTDLSKNCSNFLICSSESADTYFACLSDFVVVCFLGFFGEQVCFGLVQLHVLNILCVCVHLVILGK